MISMFLQIEQKSKWTEDTVLKKLKQTIEPKKPSNYWKSSNEYPGHPWSRTGRRLSEELVSGCCDARRKNYDIRHLTDNELNFLLEYVCN